MGSRNSHGWLLLLLLGCRDAEAPARHRPVVLISIDTLRSDHLPAYGYRAIATPNIDRLAGDAVVYEHAYTHVPLTLPSHASMFTGLLPPEHGVRDNAGAVLDAKVPTVATELRARGYATGGFVSAWVLRRSTGIANGFDTYDDGIAFVEGAPAGNLQRRGEETLARAKEWIAANRTKPFFAFVHLFEPHAPYEPSYDAEIVRCDALVGDLLDFLRAQNLYDDALIVLLSDHGEGLMDHGEQEHGVLLYREALQVPLIVKSATPGSESGTGRRDPTPIGLSAVRSLLLGEPASTKPVYAETLYPRIHLGWSDLRSIIRYPLHLIDGPKPELYDMASDPGERRDLRDTKRRESAALREELAPLSRPSGTLSPTRGEREERQQLAALGYVSAGASAAHSNLNPREHLVDLASLKKVTELMQARDYSAAAETIEALLQRHPGWADLRDQLGLAYESMGDLPNAERAYRDGIRATPELSSSFALSLGQVLLAQRKLDDAEAHARLALAANPPAAHLLIGEIALSRGELDAALREAALAREERDLDADFLVARVHAARGDLRNAVLTLQRIDHAARARRVPLPPMFNTVAGDVLKRISGSTPRSSSPP